MKLTFEQYKQEIGFDDLLPRQKQQALERWIEETDTGEQYEIPPDVPQPVKEPDFTELFEVVKANMEVIATGNEPDDSRISEAAITAIYGVAVWKWVNKKLG